MDLCLHLPPFKRNPVHGEFSLGGCHGRRLQRDFRRSKDLHLAGVEALSPTLMNARLVDARQQRR